MRCPDDSKSSGVPLPKFWEDADMILPIMLSQLNIQVWISRYSCLLRITCQRLSIFLISLQVFSYFNNMRMSTDQLQEQVILVPFFFRKPSVNIQPTCVRYSVGFLSWVSNRKHWRQNATYMTDHCQIKAFTILGERSDQACGWVNCNFSGNLRPFDLKCRPTSKISLKRLL